MNSNKLFELWKTVGKHGNVLNRIYGVSDGLLAHYNPKNENPQECIFSVSDTKGVEIGFLFDNVERDGVPLWTKLKEYIEAEGVLRNGNARSVILRWVFAAYRNTTVEAAKEDDARAIIDEPILWFGETPVYDFRINNLTSDSVLTSIYSNGFILRGIRDMAVSCNGVLFWTEYDPALCSALHHVRGWKLNRGREEDKLKSEAALVAVLSADGETKHVSFAEIVWQYHHGLIDISRFAESVIDNHKKLMDAELIIDHLTQRRTNCFSWALAAIPGTLNTTMSQRDQVAAPFYFLTVWDKSLGKYRIKLGAYGLKWEHRYLISDLGYRNPDDDVFTPRYPVAEGKKGYLYSVLFDKFMDALGDKYKDASRASYLRYWSDPERAHDEGNMLTEMLEEPADSYVDILESISDSWDDLTMIATFGNTPR